MAVVFKNNAKTTLASGINSSVTSITVNDGSLLPSLSGSDFFFATIDDGTNNEIVKVTARSSNTLTVVRAQDNTTAQSFSSGAVIELRLTAGILELFSQTGVAITDEIEAYLDANGLTFPDNVKAQFGNSNDLQIFTQSSNGNAIIRETGGGNLSIQTNGSQIGFFDTTNSQSLAEFATGGGVNLRHNGDSKFTTTSTGIDVTGTIDASGDVTTTGHYIADTHFRSSDSNATLSATGGGGVFLRPDGHSSSSNQFFIASGTGNATFGGAIFSGDVNSTGILKSTKTSFPQLQLNDASNEVKIGHSGNTLFIKRGDSDGEIRFRNTDNTDPFIFGMSTSSPQLTTTATISVLGDNKLLKFDNGTKLIGDHAFDGLQIRTSDTDAIVFKTNGNNPRFRILGNGEIQVGTTTISDQSRNLTNISTISSGAITSTGASSGRYTGLEVVNSTNAGGTETAIGLGVVSASSNACDVKLVANRVGADFGSDFYIEQTDSSGSQQETFRITESGNASFGGTISSGAITSSGGFTSTHGTSFVSSTGSGTAFTSHNSVYFRLVSPTVESGHTAKHEISAGWTADGTRTYEAPKNDGTFNFNHEFGYNFTEENWYFEDKLKVGNLNIGATNVIDSSKNLLNIGTISSGDITVNTNGKIGTAGGETFIAHNGTTDSGIRFRGSGEIIPVTFAGTGSNGVTDLGSAGFRFRNLHLSGTISSGAITSSGNVAGATMSTTGDIDFGGRTQLRKDLRIRGDGSSANLGVVRLRTNSSNTFFIDPASDGNNVFTFDSNGNLTAPGNISGTLASSVIATTQSAGDNSTKVATTAYTDTAVANLVDGAPSTLNTLNELAAALDDNADILDQFLPLSGGTMTGDLNMGSKNITNIQNIRNNDIDFIVQDTTDSVTNFIWRDHSASKLYLGTADAKVELRSNLNLQSGHNIQMNGTAVMSSGRALTNITGFSGTSTTNNGYDFNCTDSTGDAGYTGMIIDHNVSGTDTLTADRTHRGLYVDQDSSATGGDTSNEHRLYGIQVATNATGDSDLLYAINTTARAQHSSGTISAVRGGNFTGVGDTTSTASQIVGVVGTAQKTIGGTVNSLYGVFGKSHILSTNTTTNSMSAFGLYGEVELDSNTTLTNADAVRAVIDRDAGTITNGYLFRGSYEGTQPTNAFGVYISSDVRNFFAGDITIGNNTTDITGVNVHKADAQIAINDTNSNPRLRFRENGTTKSLIQTSSGSLILTSGGTTTALTLDTSQNATFAGSIASGQITITQTHPTLFLQTSGGTTNDAAYLQKFNNDLYLYNKESAGSLFLGTNNSTKVTINSSGNATFAGDVKIGSVAPQTNASLNLRRNGTNIEFGHNNRSSGFYGTLGAFFNNGHPYLAFSADANESGNTFNTRGFKANIIKGDTSGNLIFAQVTNANATGQTPTERFRIDASGSFQVQTTTIIDQSRNLTNIASLNMNTGSAVAVPKTFNIANTGSGSGRYIKFGTISSISQDGRSVKITVTSNSGYNAADSQNQETIIRFKTSNNSSNQSGFYGDCQKYSFGNNTNAPSTVLVKQVSTTEFEFYGLFSNFTGASSFYTVEHRHGTWTHDGTDTGTTAPTGTVLTATARAIFTSGTENQSAIIKVGGITHGASNVILDGSRNLTNIATISSSGDITYDGNTRSNNIFQFLTEASSAQSLKAKGLYVGTTYGGNNAANGMVQASIGFAVGTGAGGTTVIDSSRNLTNIGTISSGEITATKQITADTIYFPLTVAGIDVGNTVNQSTSSGIGIQFKLAGNDSAGDSLTGASIVARREMSGDSDSSTGLSFNVSQNNPTLDEALRLDHDTNATFAGTISSGAHTITTTGSGDVRHFFIDGADANYDFRSNSTSGYTTTFNMDNTGLEIGHNSASRNLALRTNSLDRLTISGSGTFSFNSNNLQSIGTISSGAITTTGFFNIHAAHTVYAGMVTTTSTATTSYNVIRFTQGSGSGAPTGLIGTAGSAVGNTAFRSGMNIGTQTSGSLNFIINDSYAGKFDTGGRLLIGTTSTTPAFSTGNGHAFHIGDASHISRSGGTTLIVNRGSSDGNIVDFRKDGSAVGSIGSISSDLFIAESNVGLRFDGENNQILPCSTTASTNGTCNLGASSNSFKDLHLSGTISSGAITTSGDIDLTGTSDTSSEKIILPRSGYISFYGNGDLSHAISSMGTDDIRVNSFGEIILNLDSNNNQTNTANFRIVKHGGSSSAGTSVFSVDGETGQVFLPKQGTANSTTTAYESAALVLQGSGWDTNGSVVRNGSWTIKNVPTASVYPDFDLNFYETGDELRFQLHGRGTTGHVDPSAATFHGNVNINADSSGSTGAGAGNLTVAAGISIGGQEVITASRNLTNIGTISSGAITTSGSVSSASGSNQSQLTNVGSLELTRSAANAFIDFKSSTSEDYDCRIQQSGNGLIFQTGGNGSTATGLTLNSSRNATFAGTISSGAITSSGDITAFSDERLKDNIQTLDGKKALQMRGVSYIRDGKEGSGVIAQEIEKIAPELVLTADDEQGTKSVAYGNLVGYLIEAIKDQQDQIEYMKSEIKVLKEANNGNK